MLNLTHVTAHESNYPPSEGYALEDSNSSMSLAIYHLNKACLLSKTIRDAEIRETIFNQLNSCFNCLKTQFASKNYEKAKEVSLTLYENLGEILEECPDANLREDIIFCVNDMMNAFEE